MRARPLLQVALLFAVSVPAFAASSAQQVYGMLWARPLVEANAGVPEIMSPRWKQREFSSPAFHAPSGLIFVGASDRHMRAVSIARKLAWDVELGGSVSSRPLVGSRWLYVGADDNMLYALEPTSGEQGWTHQADAEITGPITLAGDRLFFATALDTLYCVDALSGEYRWHLRRPQPLGITLFGHAAPATGEILRQGVDPQQVVAMGYADGSVAVFEAETGRELWRATLGTGEAFYDVDADPVIAGGLLVAAAHQGGVRAFELASGKELWHRAEDGLVRMARQGTVLVGAGAGKVVGIDLHSGNLLWRFSFEKGTASRPVFQQDRVLLTSDIGPMYVLDLFSGEPLQVFGSPLGMAGEPAVQDDMVFVFSNAGWLFALASSYQGWAQHTN